MSPKEICTKLSLWIVNFYLKSYIFCFHFTLYLHVWIRIHIPNTDPDPESFWIRIQYGSGSTTLFPWTTYMEIVQVWPLDWAPIYSKILDSCSRILHRPYSLVVKRTSQKSFCNIIFLIRSRINFRLGRLPKSVQLRWAPTLPPRWLGLGLWIRHCQSVGTVTALPSVTFFSET